MPIQLNYTDSDTGINLPTSYWFVVQLHLDRIAQTARWAYGGFSTLAAKNAGKNPMRYHEYVTSLAVLNIVGNTTINQILSAIDTYSLTALDSDAVTQFFSGGTIV